MFDQQTVKLRIKQLRHDYYINVEKPKRNARPKLIKQCRYCHKDFIAYSSCQVMCKGFECKQKYMVRRSAWTKQWRKRNKQHEIEYRKKHYQANRDKALQRIKDYRKTEIGKLNHRKEAIEYYHNHKESDVFVARLKLSNANWRKNNRERTRYYSHKRRCLLSDLSLKDVQRVYEDNIKNYGTLTCALCNESISFGQDTLEHLLPLSRGGTNKYSNLAIAHRSCNCSKGKKTMEEWRIVCQK